MKRRLRKAMVLAVFAACFGDSGTAGAEPSTADKTTDRALFDEGRKMVADGRFEPGCRKLEGSQQLDPGAGTMFHLADCYEKLGRTASAWTLFLEVASITRTQKQHDREKAARDRASKLESSLCRLTITVTEQSHVPGLVIKRDGADTPEAVWGSGVPVDPGKHTIQASAPGRQPWSQELDVTGTVATIAVTVPVLAKQELATPAPSVSALQPPAPPADASQGSGSGRRWAGLALGGAGVIALGVSTVLILGAKSKYNDASSYCAGNVCTQPGLDIRNDALSRGNVATVVGGLGLAAMVGGAVLYLTAPSDASAPRTALVAGPGTMMLKGDW